MTAVVEPHVVHSQVWKIQELILTPGLWQGPVWKYTAYAAWGVPTGIICRGVGCYTHLYTMKVPFQEVQELKRDFLHFTAQNKEWVCTQSQNHRMGLKRPLKIIQFPSPAMIRNATRHIRFLEAPQSPALKNSRDGASPVSTGSILQCLTILVCYN